MAQLSLSVIGFAAGGPWGAFIGGAIGGIIDRKIFSPAGQEGPRLEDLKVQISSYGAPIPELWGTMRLGGNLIWADELEEVTNTSGGKTSPEQTSYKYNGTFAIGICKGPIQGMLRAWADSTLIYDAREVAVDSLPNDGTFHGTVDTVIGSVTFTVTSSQVVPSFGSGRVYEITWDSGSNIGTSQEINSWNALTDTFQLNDPPPFTVVVGDTWHVDDVFVISPIDARGDATFDFTLYLGDETQTPDPSIQAIEGADKTPAFRGLAYIVVRDFHLEQYGNRIPNFTFEVAKDVTARNQVIAFPESVDQGGPDPPETPDMFGRTMILWIDGHTVINEGMAFDTHTGEFKTAPDPPGLAVMQYEFDFDETGIIYAWRAIEGAPADGQFVKYDLDIGFMTEIAAGPVVDNGFMPNGGSVLRVSKFAGSPYMWWINADNGALRAGPRDQLGGSAITFAFPENNADILCRHIDLDDSAGIAWAVFMKSLANPCRLFVRRTRRAAIGGYQYQTWELSLTDVPVTTAIRGVFIKYDLTTSQIIIGTTYDTSSNGQSPDADHLYFYDVSGLDWNNAAIAPVFVSVLPDVDGLALGATNGTSHAFLQGPYGGKMFFAAGIGHDVETYRYIRVDLATRTVDAEYYPEAYGGGRLQYFVYLPSINGVFTDWTFDSGWTNVGEHVYYVLVLFDRFTDGGVFLSQIVSDISGLVSLAPADINVAQLTDSVNGFVINSRTTARASIEALMQAYFFDAVEVDGKVVFKKRGSASVVSIPESDLAAHIADSQRPQELVTTRNPDLEIPNTIEVAYVNRAFDYQVGTQRERRLITDSDETLLMRLPISLSDDEAKQVAVKWLGVSWLQRTRHQIFVSRTYMYLTPADVIQVTEGGVTQTVRIEDASYEGGVIRLDLVQEDAERYVSDATGVPSGGGPGGTGGPVDPPLIVGITKFAVFDVPRIPLLSTGNPNAELPGVVVAASKVGGTWTGALVYYSFDNSNFFPLFPDNFLGDGVIGKATTVLAGPVDPFIWDEGNMVQIQLIDDNDTLASVTELAALNGGNLAILGSEIISFQTVTSDGDGRYTLSQLLRGRYGSDDKTGSHAVGEDFVLLALGQTIFAPMGIEFRNMTIYFRCVSNGAPFEQGTSLSKAITYRNLMPISPQHIVMVRDPDDLGDGLIVVDWIRRTRVGGEWNDGTDVPLGETSEAYEVDFYDGSTFLRTLTNDLTVKTRVNYTEVMQILDGTTPFVTAITAIVYQISSNVGRGIGSDPVTI